MIRFTKLHNPSRQGHTDVAFSGSWLHLPTLLTKRCFWLFQVAGYACGVDFSPDMRYEAIDQVSSVIAQLHVLLIVIMLGDVNIWFSKKLKINSFILLHTVYGDLQNWYSWDREIN